MSCFGYKVVESNREELAPIIESALALGCPVEVGLYVGDEAAFRYLEGSLRDALVPVVVHLDHRRLSLFGLEPRESALREQLAQAVRLGARYVITHCSPYPMTPRAERQPEVLARLIGGLRLAAAACADAGVGLQIENTYHDLPFYRAFFDAATAAGLDEVGICFDIGHARIWSTQGFSDWLNFLRELTQAGRRLHVHLHANSGLYDEHLSFLTADRTGLTAADAFTAPADSYQAIARIAQEFATAIKIFEVPAAEAIANRAHVLQRIAGYAEVSAAA